uniref:MerR-SF superfamily helix-turn-helix DNA-binding domain-containing protein n=1 Tax=bacterium enrichment culture clone fosmid MGS-K1 TaxID=1549356 RepID=A0A0B5KC34_9BACT|nr:MerR-SF superfamily helix-turn-helix DNA-binding domain-containing protein [bacterium enrichment culture clone fosmid MGS-K1]
MVRVEDNYVGSSEVASILGIHHFAVQRLLRSGRIPSEKIANRWLIPRAAVEEFAKTYEPRVGAPRIKRKYTKRSEKWTR